MASASSPASFCRHRKTIVQMIEIAVDVKKLDEAFAELERGLQNATPMMKEIAYIMNDSAAENFQQDDRPKWLEKKDGSPSKLVGARLDLTMGYCLRNYPINLV